MIRDSIKDIQYIINENYVEIFGRTPLKQRLSDIDKEASELCRYTDLKSLKEETSDLLGTLFQLCNECDWSVEELLHMNAKKIRKRQKQYKSLGRKTQVAILGGAFDPITVGHIQAAKLVLSQSMVFDEVYLMPCYQHIFNKKMASPKDRLEMCKLATKNDGRIKIFDYEIAKKLRGETYNLAKRLLEDKKYKETHSFSFIIGLDNANTFDTWVNYEELERLVRFVVVRRTGEKFKKGVNWYLKPPHIFIDPDQPLIEMSSTSVRNDLKGLSFGSPNFNNRAFNDPEMAFNIGLVPEVKDYIFKNNLYL